MPSGDAKTKTLLWVFIALYIAFIYLTLPVMRDVISYLYGIFGRRKLGMFINIGLSTVTLAVFISMAKKNIKAAIIPVIALFFIVYLVKRPEERVHFIEYGVLGLLVFAATGRKMFSTLVFVFLVGCVDEAIQWYLPNRVGDPRDVLMNGAGGLLGAWAGKYYRHS